MPRESKVKHMNFSPMELAKQKASDSLVGRGAADEALFEENDLSDFSAVPKIEKKSLVVAEGLDTAGLPAPRRLMTAS